MIHHFLTIKTSETVHTMPGGFTDYLFEFAEADENATKEELQKLVNEHYNGIVNHKKKPVGFELLGYRKAVKGPSDKDSDHVIKQGSRHPTAKRTRGY